MLILSTYYQIIYLFICLLRFQEMIFLMYRGFSLQKNTHTYTYIVVINSQCVFMDSMLVNMPIDERRKRREKKLSSQEIILLQINLYYQSRL